MDLEFFDAGLRIERDPIECPEGTRVGELRPACPGGGLGSVSDRGVEGEAPLADGGGPGDGHRAVVGDRERFGGG